MKNSTLHKKRRKPGYAIEDKYRTCVICHKFIPRTKSLYKHHLCYRENGKETVVHLCYTCHDLVHSKLRYHNFFQKKYGTDFGCYFTARTIVQLYQKVLPSIKKKFPHEFKGGKYSTGG